MAKKSPASSTNSIITLQLAALLKCLGNPNADGVEQLSQLSAQDWQAVALLAEQHELAPLLHHRLKAAHVKLPDEVQGSLRQAYLKNTARNTILLHELDRLLQQFQQAEIPVIVLKGAHLAQAVYASPGLRVMGDLDLLVPYTKIEPAIALLQTCGFKSERPFWPDVDGAMHYHAPAAVKALTMVELHWNLAGDSRPIQIDVQELWGQKQPFGAYPPGIFALCPTHLVLHLAAHASYGHRFRHQLRTLCDLAVVLEQMAGSLDWRGLQETCMRWQAERGVYLALRLAQDLLGAHLPEHVLEGLRPADWNEAALDWARVRLFQSDPILSENYNRMLHGSSLREKIAALFTGLFPSRQVMSMLYGIQPGSWHIWLRYPLHAATRIWKYKGYAARLAGGDEEQAIESRADLALQDWLKIE